MLASIQSHLVIAFTAAIAATLLPNALAERVEHTIAFNSNDPSKLCQANLVQTACGGFADEAPANGIRNMTTVTEIASRASAEPASALALWRQLGLDAEQGVSCMDLCRGVVGLLGPMLPNATDQACFIDETVQMVCIDVHRENLKGLFDKKKDMPNLHDLLTTDRSADLAQDRNDQSWASGSGDWAALLEYDVLQMASWVARSFHIYPVNGMTPSNEKGHISGLASMLLDLSMHIEERQPGGFCATWCVSEDNCTAEECADCNGESPFGHSVPNCLVVKGKTSAPENEGWIENSHGVMIKKPRRGLNIPGLPYNAMQGSDNDFGSAWAQHVIRVQHDNCYPDVCLQRKHPLLCKNFPVTCGNCDYCKNIDKPEDNPVVQPSLPIQDSAPEKKTHAQVIGLVRAKAEVYLQKAIDLFNQKRTAQPIAKWFGKDAVTVQRVRDQVAFVMNSAQLVLGHSVFMVDEQAGAKTYGYVYPRSQHRTKDAQGKYKVFLGPLFFNEKQTPESVQIETLTHEATHHATAFTNDVCSYDRSLVSIGLVRGSQFREQGVIPGDRVSWTSKSGPKKGQVLWPLHGTQDFVVELNPPSSCTTAYGRTACEKLASRIPQRALANADNYCYYIQDAIDDNPQASE